MRYTILLLLLGLLALASCEKDEPINPFDKIPEDTPDTTSTDTLDPASFAGLYKNVFSKTCANAGCHDGNFEPDFRTIESSYNTLVNHPLIKNDPGNNYTYRVVPGMADSSVLMVRLTRDIDGFSGTMPLQVDPDSDWPEKKAEHIENIRNWINNGARDIFGNTP